MDFSTRIVISSHKSHGDDLSRPRMFPVKGRMLLSGRLTFPLPIGACVASDRIKVRTTAVQLAVAQYQDVDIADTRAIQEFCADLIKSVLNHIVLCAVGSVRRTLVTASKISCAEAGEEIGVRSPIRFARSL